jgi:glycosyltransferase involved in cell wall biosynthesis
VFISVVITAYNRKEYLLDAIKSVLSQTLSRENYEILVIKNFLEVQIDTYCKENFIRAINTGDVPQGEHIYKGITESKGDIIAFLDDDDLYEAIKLSSIFDAFSRYPDLLYYRNDLKVIDITGKNAYDITSGKEDGLEILDVKDVLIKGIRTFRWNMSCIATKKQIYLKFLDYVKKIKAAPDLSTFYMAVEAGGLFAWDHRKLTVYRLNEKSMTQIKGEHNDALREYNSLLPLGKYLERKEALMDYEKTMSKIRAISIWDGAHASRHEMIGIPVKFLRGRISNKYDFSIFAFIILIVLITGLFGANILKSVRKSVDKLWHYENKYS